MIRRAASSADLMRASATYLRSRYPRRNPANPARAICKIGDVMAGPPLLGWIYGAGFSPPLKKSSRYPTLNLFYPSLKGGANDQGVNCHFIFCCGGAGGVVMF